MTRYIWLISQRFAHKPATGWAKLPCRIRADVYDALNQITSAQWRYVMRIVLDEDPYIPLAEGGDP